MKKTTNLSKVINLFIDTNVLLTFYHFSSENIEELSKLLAAINTGKIKLWVPYQVVHEYRRNRDKKLAESLKHVKEFKFQYNLPVFAKDYEDYSEFIKTCEKLKRVYGNLLSSISEDIDSESLAADKLIDNLFSIAQIIDEDDNIIDEADIRYKLGNPPGKDKSLGDAINWLSLLSAIPEGKDLYFISDDQDYTSEVDSERFNSFLLKEWTENHGGNLHFYKRISSFFKVVLPNIKFAADIEISVSIEKLEKCGDFSRTHKIIEELSSYKKFNKEQVVRIINAAEENSQVYWIMSDDDLKSFFLGLYEEYKKYMTQDNLKFLERKYKI